MKTAKHLSIASRRLPPLAAALLLLQPAAAAAAALTLSNPGAVTGGVIVAETTANTPALRLGLVAASGTITVGSVAASIGTGVAGVNVRGLQLWADNDNTGTVTAGDSLLATGGWSPTRGRYVFSGFSLPVTTTLKQLLVTVGAGVPYTNSSTYGAASSSAFALSVASTDVVVDTGNTVNAATITGTSFTINAGVLVEGDKTANSTKPMVAVLNPGDGATVSPTCATCSPANSFKVQVQVFSPAGAALSAVQLSTDNGATWLATPALTANANYAGVVGTNAFLYEATVTACASGCNLAPGLYTLRAHATNAGGTVNSAAVVVAVNTPGRGAGTELVRDNSSQLCIDCHAIQLHSSQSTDAKYGSWSTTCRDCHTPHRTTNVKLVKNVIAPPSTNGFQVARATNFGTAATGDSALSITSANFGSSSFTNADNTGPCQVCHTQTGGATARWRNTGNADTHYTAANGTQPCTDCHSHSKGFAGAGESTGAASCDGCHGSTYFQRMNGATTTTPGGATIVTKHSLVGASVATAETPSDVALTWGNPLSTNLPTSRSCVNMCHGDHTHDLTTPSVATHEYNGYLDATSNASRANSTGGAAQTKTSTTRDNTDYDSTQANGGMCVSCHRNPVDASHPAIGNAAFNASAHDYTSNTVGASTYNWQYTLHAGTAQAANYLRNCTKCHASREDGRPVSSSTDTNKIGAVHFSAYPSLLNGSTNPNGNAGNDYACYNCHGNGTTGVNLSGKDISTVAAKTFKHPVNSDNVHNTVNEASAAAGSTYYQGTNRHVNCLDCHNPHQAQPVASASAGTAGTATFAAGTDPAPDTLTDVSKAWTVNQWKGYVVKVVSATTGAGQQSVVYKNTATALQVKFAAAITGTASYVILPTGRATGNLASAPIVGAPVAAPTTWPSQAAPTWNDSLGTSDAAPFANGAAGLGGNVWGAITWTTSVASPVEGNLCIRCHSSFAYGATLPNTPSGAPGTSWTAASATLLKQGDKANEFNPNNLAHHAVFAPGRNQPIVSGVASNYNPNWPRFTSGTGITVATIACATPPCSVTLTGSTWPTSALPGWFINVGSAAPAQAATTWYKVVSIPSDTVLTVDRATAAAAGQVFALTAGLGATFIPPFGPWSTLACSDCHASSISTDPLGPHGTANKYLTSGTRPVKFLQFQTTGSSPAVVAVSMTPSDSYALCANCHWREVYGDQSYSAPTKASLARVPHPVDGRGDMYVTAFAGNGSKWGVACMSCHGGARSGGIHGENVGVGNNAGTGTPGSASGKRFLAGSNWYAVTRPTIAAGGHCWTKASADAVDTCTHNHKDQTSGFQTPTYDYDAP